MEGGGREGKKEKNDRENIIPLLYQNNSHKVLK